MAPQRCFRTGAAVAVMLATPAVAAIPASVGLAHNSRTEAATKTQLERLADSYDLGPWTFTHAVMIDDQAIPHSHPVLTLHTRHLRDDDLLLSTFVHEQLHWFLTQHAARTDAACADLRAAFPDLPTGYPQGSDDARGNEVHLIVGYLERSALQRLIGELRARAVIEFWAADHYTAVYRAVLDQPATIARVVRAHDLIPLGLRR